MARVAPVCIYLSLATVLSAADTLAVRSHVFLLDTSGSMEREQGIQYARYSSGFIRDLTAKLLRIEGGHLDPSHPVLIVPFSSERQPDASRGPFAIRDRSKILETLPNAADARGMFTDVAYAIRRAQNEIAAFRLPEPVAIWMVTDNKSSEVIDPLYQILRDTTELRAVWFCPLADKGAQDALVLYTIVYSRATGQPVFSMMREAERQIGYDAILFKPLFSGGNRALRLARQASYLDGSMAPTGPERYSDADDRINLTFREGEELNGYLRFRIRSELKGWRILSAVLEDGKAELNIPEALKESEQRVKVTWPIRPRRQLTVDPGSDSVNVYNLNLTALERPIRFIPRSFWTGVWSGRLPELTGTVRINAVIQVGSQDTGLTPHISESMRPRLASVRNLPEITRFMTVQPDEFGSRGDTRKLAIQRDLLIRVEISKTRRIVALAILFGLPLLLAAALLFLFSRRDELVLEGPFGAPEKLEMRFRGSHDILGADRSTVAVLTRDFRGYKIKPLDGYAVEGETETRPLDLDQGRAEFVLTDANSRGLRYILTRAETQTETAEPDMET